MNNSSLIIRGILAATIVATGSVFAQEGSRETWSWTSKKEHHDASVMIRVGKATGTGVVFFVDKESPSGSGYLGYCATAYHVVERAKKNDEPIRVYFRNGRKARDCKLVNHDKDTDVAVLWVWVPSDIQPAEIAGREARKGDELEFVGLGGLQDLSDGIRHFAGRASTPTSDNLIYADETLLPGDSGGPIFNKDGQLVGVISGGWFWFGDEEIEDPNGNPLRATWPARGANLIPLARLVAKLPECKNGDCFADSNLGDLALDSAGVPFQAENAAQPSELVDLLSDSSTAIGPFYEEVYIEGIPVEGYPIEGEIIGY